MGVRLRDGERNKVELLGVGAVAGTGAWRVSVEVELAAELDLCEGEIKVAAGAFPDDAALSLMVTIVEEQALKGEKGEAVA